MKIISRRKVTIKLITEKKMYQRVPSSIIDKISNAVINFRKKSYGITNNFSTLVFLESAIVEIIKNYILAEKKITKRELGFNKSFARRSCILSQCVCIKVLMLCKSVLSLIPSIL